MKNISELSDYRAVGTGAAAADRAREPGFLAARIDRYYAEYDPEKWGGEHIMRGLLPWQGAVRLPFPWSGGWTAL